MKKILLLLSSVCSSFGLSAQLTLTPNQTALQLANQLVATSGTLGVTIANPVLTCDGAANGLFNGVSNFGISNGIVLGTGEIMTTGVAPSLSYGLDGPPSQFASHGLSQPGDTVLGNIIGATTYDACILEFDLNPVGNFVEFEYVFGSEEYPEFNCSAFNDIFAFHISGPGFATPTNIALIPNTSIPVSINSINDGTMGACSNNTNLYVTNNDTTNTMDGFTVPLTAHATVAPGQTYHLRMAITDASDMILNSYVLLKANSLKSGNTTPNGLQQFGEGSGLSLYPTQVDQTLQLTYPAGEKWHVQVINLEGRVVHRQDLASSTGKTSLSLGHLPRGIYLVQMLNLNSRLSFTEKVIKE